MATAELLPVAGKSVAAGESEGSARLLMFDVARLVAAAGVTWLHTADTRSARHLGRFAVPFFVLSAVFFLMQGLARQPDRSFADYAVARFKRIYLPFLAWSAAYMLLRNLKHLFLSGQPAVPPEFSFLWVGSAHHLWFMPFIWAVGLALFPLGRMMLGRAGLEWPVALIAAVGGTVLALVPESLIRGDAVSIGQGPAFFLGVALSALPAVLWGVSLAIVYRKGPRRWLCGHVTALTGLIVAAVCMLPRAWYSERVCLLEHLAGLGWILLALAPWRGWGIERLARLGGLSLGIYLAHPMFIEGLQALAMRAGWRTSWGLDLSIFAAALASSTFFSALLARSRWSRWLVC